MKFLLETIFSIMFFAVFIWALPTIIGILSLGLMLYFVFSLATGSSSDSAAKGQDKSYRNYGADDGLNENNSRTDAQHEAKTKTAERPTHYSGSGYSRRRYYDEDEYGGCYNDWDDDDMPPEDEIHFRGTGAPFL